MDDWVEKKKKRKEKKNRNKRRLKRHTRALMNLMMTTLRLTVHGLVTMVTRTCRSGMYCHGDERVGIFAYLRAYLLVRVSPCNCM